MESFFYYFKFNNTIKSTLTKTYLRMRSRQIALFRKESISFPEPTCLLVSTKTRCSANLCVLNQLVIEGSIFPHKHIHKPHGDPQTTERRTRSTIFASTGNSGGHGGMWGCWELPTCHLVVAAVRLWLKKYTYANSNTRTRYNVGLLRNEDTQTAFQISLSNRF